MQRVTPFLTIDDEGRARFSAEDLLKALGMPRTQENLEMATQVIIEQIKEFWPQTLLFVKESPDPASPPVPVDQWLSEHGG